MWKDYKPGLLSHNDMDGYGCRLSFMRAFPHSDIIAHVGYDAIIAGLTEFDIHLTNKTINCLFITDLSFGKQDSEFLLNLVKKHPSAVFYYVDHHPFDKEGIVEVFEQLKAQPNFTLVHTEKFSATYINYKFLLSKGMFAYDEHFEKVIELIDVYDTWKDTDSRFPTAMILNDMFYKHKEKDIFINETSKGKLSDEFKVEMKELHHQKNEHYKYLEENNLVVKDGDFLILLTGDFISHMTTEYPNFKYYINPRRNSQISVRFRNVDNAKELKLHVMKKLEESPIIRNIGGHDTAFGVGIYDKNNIGQATQLIVHAIAEFQGIS